jgi:hypothetical protein
MIGKKRGLLAILVIFGLTACTIMQSDAKEPPLPKDINIISPSPDLPKETAVFSGKWKGTWGSGLDTILVVEEIRDTWAQIVYSQGDNPTHDTSAKFWRFKCKVIPGPKPKIHWTPSGTKGASAIFFEVIDSNTLEGTMEYPSQGRGGANKAIMKRTN